MTKKKNPWELPPVGRKPFIDEGVSRKLEQAFAMDCADEESYPYAATGAARVR